MSPSSGPSSPARTSVEQLPAGSYSTPPKNAKQHTTEFVEALGKIFAGVDVKQLLNAIDTVTGDPRSYTLIGSTALYLNAIARESENSGLSPHDLQLPHLPLPNDIDLMAGATTIHNIEKATEEDLKKVGLTRKDGKGRVFYIARKTNEGMDLQPGLKLDFVPSTQEGFEDYSKKIHFPFGQSVTKETALLDKYQNRHTEDKEFVANSGSEEKAHAKIKAWNAYFNYKPKASEASTSRESDAVSTSTRTLNMRSRALFQNS